MVGKIISFFYRPSIALSGDSESTHVPSQNISLGLIPDLPRPDSSQFAMTSLRRKQIRSPAADEEFLRTMQSLYFALRELEEESKDLGGRSTQPYLQEPKLSGTDDHPPESSPPMPEFQAWINQVLFAVGAEESLQRLRDALSRLRWKLRPERDSDKSEEGEDDETEEVEGQAEPVVVVEEMTNQEPGVEGDPQDRSRKSKAQTGQVAARKRLGKILGYFAAVWSCSCE